MLHFWKQEYEVRIRWPIFSFPERTCQSRAQLAVRYSIVFLFPHSPIFLDFAVVTDDFLVFSCCTVNESVVGLIGLAITNRARIFIENWCWVSNVIKSKYLFLCCGSRSCGLADRLISLIKSLINKKKKQIKTFKAYVLMKHLIAISIIYYIHICKCNSWALHVRRSFMFH